MKGKIILFIKWVLLTVVLGVGCGFSGAIFAKSIEFVTDLRGQNPWIILLLPLGGVLIVYLYKLLKVKGVGTPQIFEGACSDKKVPCLLTPAVFIASVVTHLLGGSAGREGAALQMGGGLSALLCRIFKLDENLRRIMTICGMGAFFSALFGTPLGACVFAVEVIHKKEYFKAIFPTLLASIVAFFTSVFLGVKPERFAVSVLPDFNFSILLKMILIAFCCGVLSIFFCRTMHLFKKLFKKIFVNDFICAIIGGVLIVFMTILVGNMDYNGSGMELIIRAFEGAAIRPWDFILKILFTAVTIAAGYKGGEIIPTFCVGATFGAVISALLGVSPVFGAAVGMAALFAGVTNCPIATVFLSIEMFGGVGLGYFILIIAVCFFFSGKDNLYNNEKFKFSDLRLIKKVGIKDGTR